MKKTNYVVCENIRSAYNVGNILRTADALWRWVVISGYAAPIHHPKVKKTALWAEESVPTKHFLDIEETTKRLKNEGYTIISAELNNKSRPLNHARKEIDPNSVIAVVMWNELLGVTQETLNASDFIYHIPMHGIKESLNVGQAAAIFMRELGKKTTRK